MMTGLRMMMTMMMTRTRTMMMMMMMMMMMIHDDIKEHYDGRMVCHKTKDATEKTCIMKAMKMKKPIGGKLKAGTIPTSFDRFDNHSDCLVDFDLSTTIALQEIEEHLYSS